LIFAEPPYFIDLSRVKSNRSRMIDVILAERERALPIIDKGIFEFDENLENIIIKSISTDVDDRFKTADEFIKALNGEIKIENSSLKKKEINGGGGTVENSTYTS
jgi:transitional endoplasmic reticulum ATPase